MKKILIILAIVLCGYMLSAQPSDPGSGGFDDPVGGGESDVPFGIEWLLIGGVMYGVSRKKQKQKHKK